MKALDLLQAEAERASWFHAYLLICADPVKGQELLDMVSKSLQIHPVDISVVRPDEASGKAGEIKVESIRQFLHEVSLSPHGSKRLGIIYGADRLNQSASNILLKTLEEPAGQVIFILVSATESVLPTIVSRCRVLRVPSEIPGTIELAEVFLLESKTGFLSASKWVEQIVKNNEIEPLLNSLEKYFREQLLEQKKDTDAWNIKLINRCRGRIKANVNPRLVLENLALTLAGKDVVIERRSGA